MAEFNVATGTCQTSGATTTQTFSAGSTGNTVQAAIFLVAGSTNNTGTSQADSAYSFGFATNEGTDKSSCGAQLSDDAAATVVFGSMHSTTACILVLSVSGSNVIIDGRAVISSFGTDSVTVDWTAYPTNADQVKVLLITGADVSAEIISASPTLTQDVESTLTTTFQWKCGFGINNYSNSDQGQTTTRGITLGAFNDNGTTIDQRSSWTWIDDAQTTTNVASYIRNNETFAFSRTTGFYLKGVEITSLNPTTVGITARTSGVSARRMIFLGLDFDNTADVVSVDSPNTAASDWAYTGLSDEPAAMIMALTGLTAENTNTRSTAAGKYGFFVSDETTNGSISISEEYNLTTVSNSRSYSDTALFLREEDDASTLYDMSSPTFTASGWTFSAANITTASTTTHKWWAIAFHTVGGVGVTVDLTGVASTSAVGTLATTGAAQTTLSGVEATSSVGVLAATGGASLGLTGVSATSAVGSLSAIGGASFTLTGVEAVGSPGVLSSIGGASFTITGVEAQAMVGTITAGVGAIVALEGVSASSAVGTLTVTGGADVTLSGVEVQGLVGVLQFGTSVDLLGVQATSAVGTLSATGGAAFALSGVQATSAVGTLSAVIGTTVELPGVQATSAVGTLSVTTGAALTLGGVAATASVGALLVEAGVITPKVKAIYDSHYVKYQISEVESDGSVTVRERYIRPGGVDSYIAQASPYTFDPLHADYGLRPFNISIIENKTGGVAALQFAQPTVNDVGETHSIILQATDGTWSITNNKSAAPYFKTESGGSYTVNTGNQGILNILCVDDGVDRYWATINFIPN